MLDYANEIFAKVAEAVRYEHIGTTVIGENVRTPSKLPTVTLDETRNVMVDRLEDSSGEENFAGVTYKLQVFSGKTGGKKAEARAIFATADGVLRKLGLRRVTYAPSPDLYESTIYNITATYEAVVSAAGYVYKP